jgi:hypothetical protein
MGSSSNRTPEEIPELTATFSFEKVYNGSEKVYNGSEKAPSDGLINNSLKVLLLLLTGGTVIAFIPFG